MDMKQSEFITSRIEYWEDFKGKFLDVFSDDIFTGLEVSDKLLSEIEKRVLNKVDKKIETDTGLTADKVSQYKYLYVGDKDHFEHNKKVHRED